jgi:hypothetical protein
MALSLLAPRPTLEPCMVCQTTEIGESGAVPSPDSILIQCFFKRPHILGLRTGIFIWSFRLLSNTLQFVRYCHHNIPSARNVRWGTKEWKGLISGVNIEVHRERTVSGPGETTQRLREPHGPLGLRSSKSSSNSQCRPLIWVGLVLKLSLKVWFCGPGGERDALPVSSLC